MGLRAGLLAAALGPQEGLSTDEAYLLGLLSSADTLFNRPLAAVLAGLPLEIDIILAAREGQGPRRSSAGYGIAPAGKGAPAP